MKKINKRLAEIFSFSFKHMIFVSIVIAIGVDLLYYFGLLPNIRALLTTLITFSSITLALVSMTLTLYSKVEGKALAKEISGSKPAAFKTFKTAMKSAVLLGIVNIIYFSFLIAVGSIGIKWINLVLIFFGVISVSLMIINIASAFLFIFEFFSLD